MLKPKLITLMLGLVGAYAGLMAQGSAGEIALPLNVPIPPGPEAAALGSYGNLPVNYFTGKTSVSIPIWTLQGKETGVNVSLSHAGGARKVEEVATWVGLGWSLNAGGVITRVVNGEPDDHQTEGKFNYFQSADMLDKYMKDELDSEENGEYTLLHKYQFEEAVVKERKYDTQPDYYYYNFGSFSGKIFINSDGQAYTDQHQGFIVRPNTGFVNGGINSWTIITTDGTQYVFDKHEWTRIEPDDGNENVKLIASRHISSWYLSSITSANQYDVVTFDYDSVGSLFQNATYPNQYKGAYDAITIDADGCQFEGERSTPTSSNTYNTGLFIKRIDLQHAGSIEFLKSSAVREDLTDRPVLDRIVVRNHLGDSVRGFQLKTSYAGSGGQLDKRLILNAVQEYGFDPSGNESTSKPDTRFEYYDLERIPNRNSLAQDYWGYYNGQTANNTAGSLLAAIVPEETGISCDIPGANRAPNFDDARVGALHTVIYPTGGETEFVYEENTYQVLDEWHNPVTLGASVVGAPLDDSDTPSDFFINCESRIVPKVTYAKLTIPENVSPTKVEYYIDFKNPYKNSPDQQEYYAIAAIFKVGAAEAEGGCLRTASNLEYFKEFDLGHDDFNEKLGLVLQNGTENQYILLVASNVPGQDLRISVRYTRAGQDLVDRKTGGMRLKTIIDRASGSSDVVRDFEYSGGKLYAQPKYYELKRVESTCPGQSGSNTLYRYASNQSVLGSVQGAIVGYSQVNEIPVGHQGKTEYHYYNDGLGAISTFPYPPASVYGHLNGKLKEQNVYKSVSDGDGFIYAPVIETRHVYKSSNNKYIKGVKIAMENPVMKRVGYYDGQTDVINNSSKTINVTSRAISSAGWKDPDECRRSIELCDAVTFLDIPPDNYMRYPLVFTDFPTELSWYCSEFSPGSEVVDGRYTSAQYRLNANFTYMEKTIQKEYSQELDYTFTERITEFEYDTIGFQTIAQTSSIDASTYTKTEYTYPYHYAFGASAAISSMMQKNMIGIPIQTSVFNGSSLVGSQVVDYASGGKIIPKEAHVLRSAVPVEVHDDFDADGLRTQLKSQDYPYRSEQSIEYDLNSGRVKSKKGVDGIEMSYLWGYEDNYIIAEVVNANPGSYFYSSFEEGSFSRATSKTGAKSTLAVVAPTYWLDAGVSGDYELTYWHKSTLEDNWTLVVEPFDNFSGSSFTINTTGYLDEVRFLPKEAQIKTYTYAPMIGLTSVTDDNNKITTYEYDDLGRLILVRDQLGNILTKHEYGYANE